MELAQLEKGCCCSPQAEALDEAAAETLANAFKALADPTRVRIVNRLARDGEACVGSLTDELGLSQPTISHHLKLLRDAGLVTAERRGTWAWYSLVPDAVARVRETLAR